MVELILEPGVVLTWEAFVQTRPPFAIALDGFVSGPPAADMRGPWVNLNHHEGVNRLATRATCEQVLVSLRMGLLESFVVGQHTRVSLYVNDIDEDICLCAWLFRNQRLLETPRSEAIHRLVHLEGLLDTTAGAYPLPLDNPDLQELAWVFQPFHERCRGNAPTPLTLEQKLEVVEQVGKHIGRYTRGKAERIELDTRYEVLGGGQGWSLVREIGVHARTAMRAHGVRAFVTVRARSDDHFNYTIARMSPYVPFPLAQLFDLLNEAEGIAPDAADRWSGGDTVGGSPRQVGSRLSPSALEQAINEGLERLGGKADPQRGA